MHSALPADAGCRSRPTRLAAHLSDDQINFLPDGIPLVNAPTPLATPPESLSPRFINLAPTNGLTGLADVVKELTEGLLQPHASISPKFFYDALGSKLFEAITALSEYYPTRTEGQIFKAIAQPLAKALEDEGLQAPCLIDLGAGNCEKAQALIPHLNPAQYVPVDISADFLRDAAQQIQGSFAALDIVGVGMDFSNSLKLPGAVQAQKRVFFYPGSSLGNFAPEQALQFLKRISDPAEGQAQALLLGIDMVKDSATLEAAYDDALGVTAAFNKNMLRHINGLLGADFDVRQWRHVALFNTAESRIEMHLEARRDVTVQWMNNSRRFAEGERIHTESSYKYTVPSMTALLQQAGFSKVQHWTDAQGWFGVFWAVV
ncbi:MAG: L-histidine N(alpha)-methyltransferase [Polaromonas sp.]|nr:L-histidine N(alpha)-methyltransferase [Polaromonas sp.]